jgi:predicted RNA-binding protein with PUA-like domain
MAYWLLKTEPSAYSYDDLEREQRTRWDGVRNPTALRNIREMQPGDTCVIYHSGDVRAAIGLAEVVTPPHADPEQSDPKLTVVDVEVRRRLTQSGPLATLKANPAYDGSPLLRLSRLSVVPLTEEQFRVVAG